MCDYIIVIIESQVKKNHLFIKSEIEQVLKAQQKFLVGLHKRIRKQETMLIINVTTFSYLQKATFSES